MNCRRVRRAGRHGLLLDVADVADVADDADDAAVRRLATWLRASRFAAQLEDVVPGGRTVLVRASHGLTELTAALRELPALDDHQPVPTRTVEIPVRYQGEDLDEVCARTGLTRSRFAAQHSGAHHVVAFFGFTPGFPYIDGVPDALRAPRRPTPRTRMPAGAVAVANGYTVIYPGGTPGGWNLVGHTAFGPLWDSEREPPNAVSVGDRIVFRDVT